MSLPPVSPPRIQVPRWIQLVGLPLVLLLGWVIVTTTGHVIFLFLIAGMVALLLDPLVRAISRLKVPRGLAVAFVYLTFLAVLVITIVALATVVVSHTKSAATRLNDYFTVVHGQSSQTAADRDVDRLQIWLNTHHLRSVKIEKSGHRFVQRIQRRDVGRYTHRLVTFVEGAAISIGEGLFEAVLMVVVSIYMLLGLPRLSARIDRRFPPRPGGRSLIGRIEHALASYVRGQILLSLIIGTSAWIGLEILGLTGLVPHIQQYALVFGAWVAVAEVLPYLGPWLGAIPPFLYALVVHPVSAIWVIGLFLIIHQAEGHIVVPKVMGNALRLHPLLVIFGLLAGTEINGLAGALMALPLLAAGHAIWEFFAERITFEPWEAASTVGIDQLESPPRPAASERRN